MIRRLKYAKSTFPELFENTELKSWAWMYVAMGHKEMAENMKSYYGNLSIVAALAAGFSISGILAPAEMDKEDFRFRLIGINGSILVCLLFACVLDCIMVENCLQRVVSDEKYMLEFIITEGVVFMRLPLLLFILGVGSTLLNIGVSLWVVYGPLEGMVAAAALLVTGLGLLRRYVLTSRKVYRYAGFALEELAMEARSSAIEQRRSSMPRQTERILDDGTVEQRRSNVTLPMKRIIDDGKLSCEEGQEC